MKYWEEVKISNFSGPLDLLYEMVKEKKMNIMDINLTEIIDQYVEYIHSQQELDIEVASEYLTLAAMLLELKSRNLLPIEQVDELENNDYVDFLQQLSKYEQIRSVTDFFNDKQQEYFSTYSPSKSQQEFKPVVDQNDDINELSNLISIDQLVHVYKKALLKQQLQEMDIQLDNINDENEDYNYIETTVLSPKDIEEMVLTKMDLNKVKEYSIFDLLSVDIMSYKNLISTFLAVLDLVRYQILSVRQNEDETDLLVRYTKYALDNPDARNGLEGEDYE